MKKTYYSNGKLLITAEYLVLDGAKALAVPTKFGQNLIVDNGQNQQIDWKSYDINGNVWFETTISFDEVKTFSDIATNSERGTLIKILHKAFLKNNTFFDSSNGFVVTTQLTFPKFWGLGTSSTLINNIAQWFAIDAFELLNESFGGSGYDIACAQNDVPILYQLQDYKPVVETIVFEPKCKDNIYFVYLNQKKSSKDAIAAYQAKRKEIDNEIQQIDKITAAIVADNTLENLSTQMQLHEKIISSIVAIPTVHENLFPDFDGAIKSLGAWGGDFVMVLSHQNPTAYFKNKGFETVLGYSEMIL